MNSKLYYYISLSLIIAGCLAACDDDDTGAQAVYMPEASQVVNNTFEISDTPYEVTYSAAFVGSDYPTVSGLQAAKDVAVTFKAEPSLVAAYNQSTGSDYIELPADSYTLETAGTIAKGASATAALALRISGKDILEPFTAYLLPVSIDQATGAAVSDIQRTTYFVFTGTSSLDDLTPFDKSAWTIVDFSSEEANGEGPDNGHAFHAIDDDPDTFWHTQWQGGEPGPPHYITIDMQESRLVHGVLIDPRNHWQGQPAEFKIEVSEDNSTWQNGGTITNLMNTQYGSENDLQHQPYKRFLPFMRTGRYLRITVTAIMPDWNDPGATPPNSTHLAEIGAL